MRVRAVLTDPLLITPVATACALGAAFVTAGLRLNAAGGGDALRQMTLAGCLMLALVLPALAAVAMGAARAPARRKWLGLAVLADLAGLVLVIAATGMEGFRVLDALKVYLILTAFCACWFALADVLVRAGRGMGVVIAGVSAAAMLALPVWVMPVVRAVDAPVQQQMVTATTLLCPVYGVLAAVRETVTLSWHQAPVMYRLSALGQDIPIALPAWWAPVAVYGGLTLLFTGLGWAGDAAWRRRGGAAAV